MDQILVLFDIDGTLISNSSAGIEAYIKAIEMCCNVKVELGDYVPDGKTDMMIMGDLMERYNIDVKTVDMKLLADTYVSVLPEKLTHDSGSVLPGVRELLDELAANESFILGLATGNLEKGAQEKLAIHDLYRYFSVGGFGSDATDRHLVVAAGIKKAKKQSKGVVKKSIVIGDTPMDIKAAKMNDIAVLAVATGKFSLKELKNAGADIVVPNLKDKDEIIRLLLA